MSLLPFFFDKEDYVPIRFQSLQKPNENDYVRPWRLWQDARARQDSGSQIVRNNNAFQVNLDVQQFAPEEINVKTFGNEIIIEGKHEEKEDKHGYISRHFVRKYVIPEGHEVETAKSTLSSDGVLSITVQKVQQTDANTRSIPITHTGAAHKPIKAKAQENKK